MDIFCCISQEISLWWGRGTAKQCLTRESLSRPTGNHILTAEDAFKFCNDSIHGIHFIFLNQQYVDEKRTFMQTKRNVLGDTIPGTQIFHHFFPIHIGVIACKMTSEDPSFYGCRNFFTAKSHSQVPPPLQIVLQHFVACIYDDEWWIGMVEGIEDEGDMVNINFMHQKGLIPNSGFQWPRRPDICPVNSKDVLLSIDTPALSSNTARSYSISRDVFTTIEGIFNNRNYVSVWFVFKTILYL